MSELAVHAAVPGAMQRDMANVYHFPDVVGDGVHDDTAGLQAALDSGAATVYFPTPPRAFLISQTLVIHSGQTLLAERNAVIRLADHAHAHMLTNAQHAEGDHGITVIGGIWDGNNVHQTCEYHENGCNWRVPFDPARYLGVLLQFNNVTDLRIAHLTLKDPETFGFQAGNLRQFTIEDITFDYNLLRENMDGVHLHGNCHQGRIVNLKGATNDDLLALNADDGSMYELSRGPITDIAVDGIWAENGCTAVRLLSAGSPIRRIKLANIFGTYRYYVIALSNHQVHPGAPSTFDDISIDGVFCAKTPAGRDAAIPVPILSSIWIDRPAHVSHLTLRNYHRTEAAFPADDIYVEPGAHIEHLVIDTATLVNQCAAPITFLHNHGTIDNLGLQQVYVKREGEGPGGTVVNNAGTIANLQQTNVTTSGFEFGG